MTTLRTLKLVNILLSVALIITALAIGLREIYPVGADQKTPDQEYRVSFGLGCLLPSLEFVPAPCYSVDCERRGKGCSHWAGACFTLDEDDEDGYFDV